MYTITPDEPPPNEPPPNDPEGTSAITTAMARAEIDSQIATANAYPRSPEKAFQDAYGMATLTPEVAESCYYTIIKGGKKISGPSVSLARICVQSWGNINAGARYVSSDGSFLHYEGVCHDLQKNVKTIMPVARRSRDKYGKPFRDDVMQSTHGAAASIAYRNAVRAAVPIMDMTYAKVVGFLQGDEKSLPERRKRCVAAFSELGISAEQVLAKMDRQRIGDLTLSDVFTLRGFYTAIKDGDVKVETIFPTEEETKVATNASALKDKLDKAKAKRQPRPQSEPKADAPPTEEVAETAPPDTDATEEAPAEPTRITLKHIESRLRGIYAARKSLRDVLSKFIFDQQPPEKATAEQLSRADDILTAFVKSGDKPDEIPDLFSRLKGLKI